jgi:hypothetical protein
VEALKAYWATSSQVEKAEKMAIAKKQVKNMSGVGRKGKAGKEALLVSYGIGCFHTTVCPNM